MIARALSPGPRACLRHVGLKRNALASGGVSAGAPRGRPSAQRMDTHYAGPTTERRVAASMMLARPVGPTSFEASSG